MATHTSTNWMIVLIALVGAALLIALAIFVPYYQSLPDTPTDLPLIAGEQAPAPVVDEGTGEWQAALEALALKTATSPRDFRAPAELGTTASVSQELIAAYVSMQEDGTLGTAASAAQLDELLRRNVTVYGHNDTYTLASVRTDPKATLDTYVGAVSTILERSTVIREYELATFAQTVRAERTTGTPSLKSVASIYRSIEHDLVAAPVPNGMADAHLNMVKSIAFLARSIELMAGWSGDPIDAMSYMDAFVRADRETKVAFDSLFTAIAKLSKSS